MTMKSHLSLALVSTGFATITAAGCQHRAQAHASGEPDRAHAEARVDAQAGKDDHASARAGVSTDYRVDQLARTGVQISRDIATQCAVDGAETFFAFDSAQVNDRSHAVLDQVARCVTDGPLAGRELVLVGFTDPRGTDAYNEELGRTRAESIAQCLREHGVAPTQIEINSMGEKQASEDASDWPLDRRVEINLDPKTTASR